ncbi:hypothetical protein LC55x_5200 [Lysobacter capsici]|nr:hypothetical protein LC55x_5200 [Lysobacter capsici]
MRLSPLRVRAAPDRSGPDLTRTKTSRPARPPRSAAAHSAQARAEAE